MRVGLEFISSYTIFFKKGSPFHTQINNCINNGQVTFCEIESTDNRLPIEGENKTYNIIKWTNYDLLKNKIKDVDQHFIERFTKGQESKNPLFTFKEVVLSIIILCLALPLAYLSYDKYQSSSEEF